MGFTVILQLRMSVFYHFEIDLRQIFQLVLILCDNKSLFSSFMSCLSLISSHSGRAKLIERHFETFILHMRVSKAQISCAVPVADQCLCFHRLANTISLVSQSEI